MLPHAAHARQVVLELRELDLELSLGARRVLGEDVEDQLRPVDHARVERVLEEALLRRIELVVDDQALGARAPRSAASAPRACPCRRRCAAPDGRGAARPSRPARHPAVRASSSTSASSSSAIDALGQHREDEPALRLRGTWNHRRSIMPASDPAPTLAETALELVNIPSESRSEAALYAYVAGAGARSSRSSRTARRCVYAKRSGKPLVLLAGHTRHRSGPGQPARADRGRLGRRARRERHEGRPRRDDRARPLGRRRRSWPTTSRSSSSRARSSGRPRTRCRRSSSELPLVDEAALVICLEPTDNTLQLGCLGNLNARVVFEGRSAHSARPWLGVNAIGSRSTGCSPCSQLEPRDVEIDGLRLPRGAVGDADPRRDRDERDPGAGRGDAELPLRARPHARRRRGPRARAGRPRRRDPLELAAGARRASRSPVVEALRAAGGLEVQPKQAWTNVADFAARGLDAVNFGPGATRYAHAVDERVEIAALERTLRRRCSASCSVPSSDARAALPRPRRARAVPVRAARRLEGRRAARAASS